jgi:hypothetical protein
VYPELLLRPPRHSPSLLLPLQGRRAEQRLVLRRQPAMLVGTPMLLPVSSHKKLRRRFGGSVVPTPPAQQLPHAPANAAHQQRDCCAFHPHHGTGPGSTVALTARHPPAAAATMAVLVVLVVLSMVRGAAGGRPLALLAGAVRGGSAVGRRRMAIASECSAQARRRRPAGPKSDNTKALFIKKSISNFAYSRSCLLPYNRTVQLYAIVGP